MERVLKIILLLLISQNLYSNINTDSLYNQLKNEKKFYKPQKVSWQIDSFYLFTSIDSTENFLVFLDQSNNLSSSLDLCILYRKFDLKKRLLKMIGYSKDGRYSYWDFSPIVEKKYNGDTTIESFFDSKYVLNSTNTKIVDKKGRIVCDINESFNPRFFIKTKYIYTDKKNEVYISKYDSLDKIIIDKNGVAYIKKESTDTNEIYIVTQTYLDITNKLVDANHKIDFKDIKFSFSKFIKEVNYSIGAHYEFYNKKNEAVFSVTYIGEE